MQSSDSLRRNAELRLMGALAYVLSHDNEDNSAQHAWLSIAIVEVLTAAGGLTLPGRL